MDPDQEQTVVRGLRAGEASAWQALYDAFARQVWAIVARVVGPSVADVADVVQETFMAAARSARQFDPSRGSLWSWLSGITRRHLALHFRSRQRQERLLKAIPGDNNLAGKTLAWLERREALPAEAAATAELAGLVRAVLNELPLDYQLLLTAKYCDGASVADLAAQESCSLVAVRSKLARARRAFRDALVSMVPSYGAEHAQAEHEPQQ
jgi:RNA polymerase sigma-70 factor (ECF subfamily)